MLNQEDGKCNYMMPNPECMEAGMPVYQYEDSTGMAVCGAECLPNSHWNFTWNACSWNDYCEGNGMSVIVLVLWKRWTDVQMFW